MMVVFKMFPKGVLSRWFFMRLLPLSLLSFPLGIIPIGLESEAHALSTGQRVRFSYHESGRRFTQIGQVLALSGKRVRVRYLKAGQQMSRWVNRSQVTGLSGTGNLVYTCRADSKIYRTRTNRRVCCPPTATGYHTRSGGDVICCPGGTSGVHSGQHHIICRYNRGGGSACRPGHKLFRAKSGKGYCCPPGTSGYYQGYNGITCRRSGATTPHHGSNSHSGGAVNSGIVRCPRGHQAYRARRSGKTFCCPPGTKGNTITGQCRKENVRPCPPVNPSGHTAASCVRYRGTTWKCFYSERPGGSNDKPCKRCACKW